MDVTFNSEMKHRVQNACQKNKLKIKVVEKMNRMRVPDRVSGMPTGSNKKYRGQTGQSTYHRVGEHIEKWEAKAEDSYLHKHAVQYHNGGTSNINVKILAQCYGKPTTRMITAAVTVEELPDDNSLKSEWTYVKLLRVAVL